MKLSSELGPILFEYPACWHFKTQKAGASVRLTINVCLLSECMSLLEGNPLISVSDIISLLRKEIGYQELSTILV